VTTTVGRSRYEGANIRTWVGFKHFMYLAEEAVLQWFRDRGVGPHRLYHFHGLGLTVVDSSVQLPAVLDVDDEVTAEVATNGQPGRFDVRLGVQRAGSRVGVLRGRVAVALVAEREAPESAPAPAELASMACDSVEASPAAAAGHDLPVPPGAGAESTLTPAGSAAFCWTWRVPYFYCHFSDRMQHSGYVRALEEVVDRFLADRGLSVGRLLAERGWIPVVSRARVRLVADAHMEETMHTVFTVTDLLKGVTFDGRMDCYVRRGDTLVHTATARILHGYAVSRGVRAGQLAELDPATVRALRSVPA
jgi:acyl-CoA thioesterase FadM